MRKYFEGEEAIAVARKVPCPQPKGRWNPRPHGEIIEKVLEVSEGRGWNPNVERLQVSFSQERARMFGTVPMAALVRDEHEYILGFVNSVNRSLSLRILFGTNTFVCANGMFVGEVSERRLHTTNIDVAATIEKATEGVDAIIEREDTRLQLLKDTTLSHPDSLFFDAVKLRALAKSHVVDAREEYYRALDGDDTAKIENPGTLWAFQNSVTAQWKRARNPESKVWRSNCLRRMVDSLLEA